MIITGGKGDSSSPEASLLVALLPSITEAALNPVGRLELLGWLLSQLENPALVVRYEWMELLKALVVAMQVLLIISVESTLDRIRLLQRGLLQSNCFAHSCPMDLSHEMTLLRAFVIYLLRHCVPFKQLLIESPQFQVLLVILRELCLNLLIKKKVEKKSKREKQQICVREQTQISMNDLLLQH
jgi:hypothetical protein